MKRILKTTTAIRTITSTTNEVLKHFRHAQFGHDLHEYKCKRTISFLELYGQFSLILFGLMVKGVQIADTNRIGAEQSRQFRFNHCNNNNNNNNNYNDNTE